MKLLKHRSKIIKKANGTVHGRPLIGGSINHLLDNTPSNGNITELKKQLKNLVIKPKKSKKITF